MDRRSFLKLFAAAGPVAAVAPTYFFAPVGGWRPRVRYEVQAPYGGMYFIGENGIYLNGSCITRSIELSVEELRAMYPMPSANERLNKVCELMDDYAGRCGAEWTDKQWT
jgi:hypothetical protein